ncbi:MAG: N-formylglutamate amidohydrolase [Pirellulaceae bacterium]
MPSERNFSVVLSCEHATNFVPAAYRHLFAGREAVLSSHRGWDPGTLELGRAFTCKLQAPLFVAPVSRLLVEVNRSVGHRRLFSEFSSGLAPAEQKRLLSQYYFPHRNAVEAAIRAEVAKKKQVLHLSLHSFTPVLGEDHRRADVGLLYDPKRIGEREFSSRWISALRDLRSELIIRRNYPYLGTADGFTTYLRRHFPQQFYWGIELELNQRFWLNHRSQYKSLVQALTNSLANCIWNRI